MERRQYHDETSVSRQEDLRANQKERTRAALVDAASAWLRREGSPPTVVDAAREAKVSRATAYRYFPTQESLLSEIADMSPLTAPVDALLAELTTDDVEERVGALVRTAGLVVAADPVAIRTALRVYIDTWLAQRQAGNDQGPVRAGRRMGWIDEVLEPIRGRLSDDVWRRLRSGLALTVGPDAIVVLKDVCQLSDDDAVDALVWSASMLVRGALADVPESPRRHHSATRRIANSINAT